jgi:hypothetical protein
MRFAGRINTVMTKDMVEQISEALNDILRQSGLSRPLLRRLQLAIRGFNYSQQWKLLIGKQTLSCTSNDEVPDGPPNPLRAYFDSHEMGRGIWKWTHYFDIYHRHFSKFVGCEVHVAEVGVHSGGSLCMWRDYFGQNCRVYGVDIEETCKTYENDWTKIFVGDQADREFWKFFKEQVPVIDILIDDGGHQSNQQIVTLEEMLPHLRSGGVYLCEDTGGDMNEFNSYVYGLASHLNSFIMKSHPDEKIPLACIPTPFQATIHSMHLYPFVTVIEKTNRVIDEFIAPKHGTEWQAFS